MHAHDFRDACEFKDKTVLLVGASYSAEDIALQVIKYGAKHVICTWRTKPMGYNWPSTIEERPLLTNIDGNTISFRDGSTAEVDAILLCTGYLHAYPFLSDDLSREYTRRVNFGRCGGLRIGISFEATYIQDTFNATPFFFFVCLVFFLANERLFFFLNFARMCC